MFNVSEMCKPGVLYNLAETIWNDVSWKQCSNNLKQFQAPWKHKWCRIKSKKVEFASCVQPKGNTDFNISTFKVLWPKPNLTAAVSPPLPRGYCWYDSDGNLAVDLPSTHVNGDGLVHAVHAVRPCKVVFICVCNFRPGCFSHTLSAVAVSYPGLKHQTASSNNTHRLWFRGFKCK